MPKKQHIVNNPIIQAEVATKAQFVKALKDFDKIVFESVKLRDGLKEVEQTETIVELTGQLNDSITSGMEVITDAKGVYGKVDWVAETKTYEDLESITLSFGALTFHLQLLEAWTMNPELGAAINKTIETHEGETNGK